MGNKYNRGFYQTPKRSFLNSVFHLTIVVRLLLKGQQNDHVVVFINLDVRRQSMALCMSLLSLIYMMYKGQIMICILNSAFDYLS